MNSVSTIARHTLTEIRRNRVFLILISLFLASSLISIYVGSATIRTELTAYNLAARIQDWSSLPSSHEPPSLPLLSVMKNSIEYVLMIGCLLSIFIGYDGISRDMRTHTLELILSREVYRDQYLTGKMLGGLTLIAFLHLLSFLVELIALMFIAKTPVTLTDFTLIFTFHIVSIVMMMLFYILSLLFSVVFAQALPSFLTSISIWVAGIYIIPELARSVASYTLSGNTAQQNVQSALMETPLSKVISSLSPASHFRSLGTALLEKGTVFPFSSLFYLMSACVIAAALLYILFQRKELTRHV